MTKSRQCVKNAKNEIASLKEKICNLIQKSESVDQGLHGGLATVIHENTSDIHKAFLEGSFCRVFCDQQLEEKPMHDNI